MKRQHVILFVSIILILVVLACGSTSDIEVNQPDSKSDQGSQSEEVIPEVSPTKAELGTSRDNPAPFGSEIIADDMSFSVLGITRPATDIIMQGNQFNTEPEENQEYILVDLSVTCKKSTSEQCNLSTYNFKVVGSSGIVRDAEWFVAGVDGILENTDFYGEATLSGKIPFIVGTDEVNLLLVYEPLFGDSFYLSLQ